MPNNKFKHSIRLIIKLTYSKKLYPILNKFKYIIIYDNPITVSPKPNKNNKNFIDKFNHLYNILFIIFIIYYIIK